MQSCNYPVRSHVYKYNKIVEIQKKKKKKTIQVKKKRVF